MSMGQGILILSASVGAGHLRAAHAVELAAITANGKKSYYSGPARNAVRNAVE
jgi:hypothetical protein